MPTITTAAATLVSRSTPTPQVAQESAPPAQGGGEGAVPPTGDACLLDAPIKGNVGSNGNIYHVPGSANYEVTDPEPCFASAADAAAAGFRAPRR